jgi:predicted TIM-barrel fold metal-dependent hydrolase
MDQSRQRQTRQYHDDWSRRELLRALSGGIVTAAAGGIVTEGAAWAQPPARRLDVHHHFASPQWIRKMTEAKRQGWQRFADYTPERSIETMDNAGVETAFVSCTLPGVSFTENFARERRSAIALAREMNEYGARMVADYRGRFGLFAVLPLPALKGLVGASQIVFGADYPYTTILDHVEGLRGCGFTAAELAAIDRGNALRILPKYAH